MDSMWQRNNGRENYRRRNERKRGGRRKKIKKLEKRKMQEKERQGMRKEKSEMREKQEKKVYKMLRKKEGGDIRPSLGHYHGGGHPDIITLIAQHPIMSIHLKNQSYAFSNI